MEIIFADEKNISDIVKIENECFEHPWSENSVRTHIMGKNNIAFVCMDGKDVAGYAGMTAVLDEGQIMNIAVLPRFRRHGYGDALVLKLKEYCKENNLSFMTLEVRASNIPAIKLYEKHGFKRVGLRKKYYGGTEDAVLMTFERGDGSGCGQE